jgi:hypothetical protein
LLHRVGDELRAARVLTGRSARAVSSEAGISHTQLLRIERALAPHVDLEVLARVAAASGHELSLAVYPASTVARDAAHLALLERLRSRIAPTLQWRSEVPVPLPGDRRSADATVVGTDFSGIVEAQTRLGDVQAVERSMATKARDLGVDRRILLVLDSRHNRSVLRGTPGLDARFPIGTRAGCAALARGEDPGGDCLIVL